ncbi:AraC-type DNA-binding protein [Allokutzneria albata]|uniref:AraC-type DNA-binding protein n=1 Tax=Allokutzneria albata TaxID=211114 RepID=A0A1G9SFM4_ALLAB|nr:AraC-type DNA-binding protein [Allokutzneria albata]
MFETTDYEHAGEYLAGLYGSSIQLSGGKDGHRYRYVQLGADTFTIASSSLSREVTFDVGVLPALSVLVPRDITMEHRSAGIDHRFGPGEALLATTSKHGSPFTVQWQAGEAQALTLPFETLGRVAATADTRHGTPIRFTDLRPSAPTATRHLLATIDYLADALRDRPQAMREPLVATTAGNLLAATVLATFPNTALIEPTSEDRHDAHTAALHRAIAFIDDYAHLDITVADIAAAAHVTIRALQYAFRKHQNTTPTRYLRLVRLQRVHQELLAADPTAGVTITDVAARWGFFHPGRFASYYRRVYGCPPSRTLFRRSS